MPVSNDNRSVQDGEGDVRSTGILKNNLFILSATSFCLCSTTESTLEPKPSDFHYPNMLHFT